MHSRDHQTGFVFMFHKAFAGHYYIISNSLQFSASHLSWRSGRGGRWDGMKYIRWASPDL